MLHFDKELHNLINTHSINEKYKKGEIINSANYSSKTFFIIDGQAKIYLKKGRQLFFLHPLNTINLITSLFIFSTKYRHYDLCLKFTTNTTVLIIDNHLIEEWSNHYIELKTVMLSSSKYMINSLISTYNNLAFLNANQKVFNYLKTFFVINNNKRLRFSFTEIAFDINISRALVSKVVKKLAEEKKISYNINGIKILDFG